MTGFLKDDLTVALDDVDRVTTRIITIYRDLSAVAGAERSASRLLAEAERREAILSRFNQARQAHGQVPEVDDPERSHLQALWMKLKSLLSQTDPQDSLAASLAELDQVLRHTVAAALALQPEGDIRSALEDLVAERQSD